ncbi:MAG TPA: molybdate ABC transporter substrate-binding protein, partial [Sphingopyxis sp.]|nr:molybdate ABC transporter substrate-binding protein [Sphingopyxis sp.]
WSGVAAKVAPAENVRAAMALVERGAAPLGIVYATDARASKSVRIVGTFPATSHPPIRYPVALLKASRHKDAVGFRAFLLSKQGRAIFARHGFSAP